MERRDDDLKIAYQQAADFDVPDLWNRIEAGFDEEVRSVKRGERNRNFRVAGLAAAVVLAIVIAIPVFGLGGDKKSDTRDDMEYSVSQSENKEDAAYEEEAAGEAEIKDEAEAVYDGEESAVQEVAPEETTGAQINDATVTGETPAYQNVIVEYLEGCDVTETPQGVTEKDVWFVEGYWIGANGAELVKELYSDGSVKTPTKKITELHKYLQQYDILGQEGCAKDELPVADFYYVFRLHLKVEGERTEIYRIYPAGCGMDEFAEIYFLK